MPAKQELVSRGCAIVQSLHGDHAFRPHTAVGEDEVWKGVLVGPVVSKVVPAPKKPSKPKKLIKAARDFRNVGWRRSFRNLPLPDANGATER